MEFIVYIETAEAIKRHRDCPEKPAMIADLLAELEERTDLPKEVRERVREILAA